MIKNLFSVFLLLGYIEIAFCDEPNKYIQVNVDAPSFSANKINVGISNADNFSHVVYVEFFNDSFKNSKISYVLSTIKPKKTLRLEAFKISSTPFGPNLLFRIFDAVGTLETKNRNYELLIPFSTDAGIKICQSSDGPLTSHSPLRKNAVDFCADEYTPILAAKSGVVVEVIQEYTQGGRNLALLGKENKVRILHDDGLVAVYAHIAHNSSAVKVGDRVDQGQQIAKVGNVGYSTGPHLHLELNQAASHPNEEAELYDVIPIIFMDSKNQSINIKYGDVMNPENFISGYRRLPSLPKKMF
ncbi:M23 family metallopeptidase [Polynucleobacter paneuropaeus]|nr:M23 family metallopeptidase [Polynucleobacter paneuropaeus]